MNHLNPQPLGSDHAREGQVDQRTARISVAEIARRLDVGRLTVYAMLEQGILPGIHLGRRWIVTRHAYMEWERTCGTRPGPGLTRPPEVMVLS